MGIDGNSSGILQFEDSLSLAEWIAAITNNITQLLNQMVSFLYYYLCFFAYTKIRAQKFHGRINAQFVSPLVDFMSGRLIK